MKMKMKKRTGKCTEDIFWDCVSEIGWKDKDEPHPNRVKRACLIAWTAEFGSSFWEILGEKEGEVSRQLSNYQPRFSDGEYSLGSDSFGDLCSHVVGLGRVTFQDEMENPQKVFWRARDENFREKFSYCIPHEANPQTTWEKWMEMHGAADEKSWEEEWESGRYGHHDATFEEHVERTRRQHVDHQLGDWSYLDPGHYVPMAKRYHSLSSAFVAEMSSLEAPNNDEKAAMGFAALLMAYFGALVDGNTEDALSASDEALRAWWGLYYIDKDLGALRKVHAELLPMSEGQYGGENTINDHRIYMGGLPGFKCQHHYKLLQENAKSENSFVSSFVSSLNAPQ